MIKLDKDHFLVGFIPALIMPVLVGVGYYFYKFGFQSSENYTEIFLREEMLSPLLALGCFFNLVIFFVLLKLYLERSAQGVIFATILYGVGIAILKMF